MNKVVCRPVNCAHYRQDNCVKIGNLNCNWNTTLYDTCDWSIMPYGPGEVSIKS